MTCKYYSCSGLTSIAIGSGVTSIGKEVFEGCENISEVYAMMKEPCSFLASSTFSVYDRATLYVPIGCKEKYESQKYWNKFQNIVEVDYSGVTTAKERDTSETVIEIYDLQGRRTKLQRGISIERRADGTARKVLVK